MRSRPRALLLYVVLLAATLGPPAFPAVAAGQPSECQIIAVHLEAGSTRVLSSCEEDPDDDDDLFADDLENEYVGSRRTDPNTDGDSITDTYDGHATQGTLHKFSGKLVALWLPLDTTFEGGKCYELRGEVSLTVGKITIFEASFGTSENGVKGFQEDHNGVTMCRHALDMDLGSDLAIEDAQEDNIKKFAALNDEGQLGFPKVELRATLEDIDCVGQDLQGVSLPEDPANILADDECQNGPDPLKPMSSVFVLPELARSAFTGSIVAGGPGDGSEFDLGGLTNSWDCKSLVAVARKMHYDAMGQYERIVHLGDVQDICSSEE